MTEKIKYVPKYKNKYIRPERIDALGAQGLTLIRSLYSSCWARGV